MKSRSHHRLPINNEPPDDWGDGSWTVDCVCGVNFDDGEEMVNCDECGVWVHTRCSRYVKGETSFACDKCKIKKYRNNDNEETEVAQLLVELPTKTMTMDHSRPSSAPPRSSFRLWTEIPMEERVHVQGLPGGDPALFQGLSSVFTSELWKCSGYVPKKFNFKYREFPCWDEKQQESSAKIDEDNENPVDRGADALFSLSKEIVSASPVEMLVGLRGSVERVSREKKSSKKEAKKRDRNDASDGYTHNAVTRDTNHLTSGIHLGKRKKDNIRFKDLSAKKKARSANKEADGRKRVPTTTIGAQQAELLKVGETKVVERGLQDSNNRDKTVSLDLGSDGRLDVNRIRPKDNVAVKVHYAGASFKKAKSKGGSAADVLHAEDSSKKAKPMHSLEANAEDCYKKVKPNVSLEVNVHHADEFSKKGKPKDKLFSKPHHAEDFTKKVKPKDNLATNAFHSGDTSKEEWRNSSLVEIVVKSENDHQAPTRTGSSSETVPIEVSLLEPNVTSINKKHEDFGTTVNCLDHLNDEKHVPGDLDGNSSNDVLTSSKLKPPVGDLRNVVTEVQDSGALPDSIKSTSASSLRPDIKVKSEANDDHLKGILSALSSSVDANQDSTKHLERHLKISVCEHPYEDVQVHEIDKSNFPSHEDVVTESRASSCCDKNTTVEGMIPISGEPCKNKEVIGSAGTLSVQESSSEPKHLKNVEDSSKTGGINASPLSPLTQRKVVPGFGKASSSSSSAVVISKSEVSGSCKPPGRPASPSTLRPIHFTKRVKVNSFGDIKKDHTVTDAVKDDFRHEEQRKTARDQLKASAVSAPKPSHMSRISHAYISKRTSSDSKGSVLYPNSKAPVAQNVAISSGSSESTSTLQSQNVSLLQNKTTALGFSEKGEKFNQLGSHHSSKVAQLSSMHPPAPVNSSSTLSDEELALLLHQELNSSPRVPRVPRMRHAGSIPQSASPTTTTMLMKCTSSSGVKDHISVSRKKSKEEAPKDGSHNSHELTDETKKIDRVLSSNDHRRQDQVITSDGTTKKEAHGSSEVGHSAKKNTPLVVNTTFGQSSSNEATDQNLSSWRNSSRDTSDDDDAGGIAGRATRTLPGLLDEIMSKGRRMTYEELCNAVLPHWNNLRKHNGERYAYSSHSQAVLDCLRNRNEWAQLVDRGPKTNAGRKKRKVESEPSPVEPEENEYSKSVSKNFEAHPEDFPKGKRKARKRRRLALQGRGIRDIRKRQKANALTDDDDLGQFSHSSDNDDIFSEDSQGARTRPVGSEASSSFEETGSM